MGVRCVRVRVIYFTLYRWYGDRVGGFNLSVFMVDIMTNSSVQWDGFPLVVGEFLLKKGLFITADRKLKWVVGIVSQQSGKNAVAVFDSGFLANDYFLQLRETLGD